MKTRESGAFERAWRELQRSSLLLVSDAVFPSAAAFAVEAPLRGSLWAHPQAHEIYRVAKRLGEHREVLTVRLIAGKLTYVHRKLWPALFAVAASREPWQLQGLLPVARLLLARVDEEGTLRTNHLTEAVQTSTRVLGEAARDLERRLLAYGESVHSESGTHYKQLESWAHLAHRLRITRAHLAPEDGKREFEKIATAWAARFGKAVRLPWRSRGIRH